MIQQKLVFYIFFLLIMASCTKEPKPLSNHNSITHFSLEAENNPSLSQDITLTINENTILGNVPYGAKIDSLVASFEVDGQSVKVSGIVQQSDFTPNNFRDTLHYAVHSESGETSTYSVYIQYFSGLPVLSISTENGTDITSKEDYINGNIAIQGLSSVNDLASSVKIRGRGNSTWLAAKKPYQIKFDDKQSVLGMPKDKRWILLANYSDKSLLRNKLAFELGHLSDLEYTPTGRFVELFINGNYQGNYQLTQKVEESSNRVNIGDAGFLLEVDQRIRLNEDDVYFRTDRYLFNIKEPELEKGDAEYQYIKSYISSFENILFSDNFRDPIDGYRKYVDVESFADWYIINELSKNNDADFVTSVFMNVIPGEKLKMGPIWDFDIAFGNINYNENDDPTGFWVKNSEWMSRLFEDSYFVDVVKTRFEYFTANRDVILDHLLQEAIALEDSQRENFQKWKILGTYVWPNSVFFDTYEEEVIFLHSWLLQRWDWMSSAVSEL